MANTIFHKDGAKNFYTKDSIDGYVFNGNLGINNNSPQYTLDVNGSISTSANLYVNGGNIVNSISIVTGSFSIPSGRNISLVSGGATGILPNSSGLFGATYVIKDWKGLSQTNNITISGYSGQLIDGQSKRVLSSNYGSLTVVSDGANWAII